MRLSLLEKYVHLVMYFGFFEIREGNHRLTDCGKDFLMRFRHGHKLYFNSKKLVDALDNERDKLGLMCRET